MNSQLTSFPLSNSSNTSTNAKPIMTTGGANLSSASSSSSSYTSSNHASPPLLMRQQGSSASSPSPNPIYSSHQHQPLLQHHNEYMGPSKPSLHFVGGYQQRYPAYMDCKEGWRLNDPKTKHPHSTTHNCSIKDHIIIHGNDFENCKCFLKLRDNEEGKVVSESFFSYDHHNHRYFVEFPVVSKINNMKGNTSSRVVYIDIYDSKNKLICVSDAFWVRSRSRSQMMLDLAKRKREQTHQVAGPNIVMHRQANAFSTPTSTTPYSNTSPRSNSTLEEEDRDSLTSAEKQQIGSAMMMVDFSNQSDGKGTTGTSKTPASSISYTLMGEGGIGGGHSPSMMTMVPYTTGATPNSSNASSYPLTSQASYSPQTSSSPQTDPLSSLANVASSIAGAAPLTPTEHHVVPSSSSSATSTMTTSQKQMLPSIDALTLGSDDEASTTNPLVEDHSSSAIHLPHIDSFIKKRKFEDRYRLEEIYHQLERNKEDISKLSRMIEDQNRIIQDLSMKITNMEAQSKKPKFN
nr:unnamed protein product [Naegleria fowleri]